jgi:amino acid adenylation domain-containing protein
VRLAATTNIQDTVHPWVRRQPSAVAVHDPGTGESLSYKRLWERAGELADGLIRSGIGRGDVVAVALGRSVGLVVAQLAILRAGAAYLPLDDHAPPDRIAGMLTEAGVRLTVTAGDTDRLPPDARRLHLPSTMDRHQSQVDGQLSEVDGQLSEVEGRAAEPSVGADDPAYVMYTSGSTGRPKGVLVPHRAVLRLAVEPNYCVIEPGDRVAHGSNPAFDASTFEVWSTLVAGGTVVVFPSAAALTVADWMALIARERITTTFLTTSLFHAMARERPDAFGALRNLVVGGEQLDLATVRRVLAAAPPGRLVNGYGPTETTTFAAYYECTADSLAGLDRIPVGYPLQNTTLYVLDEVLAAVPDSATGELCVGGPGVALGYAGRPDLTAERFVTGPGGVPVYRTGDLARTLRGGAIEVLGRRDRQVKLRGFRIELAEIEQAALATGLLDAAFVEKVGDGPDAGLVGFLLPRADLTDHGELTERLAGLLGQRLPAYMVPARWRVLDRLPLGPTGKTDRAQLLALLDRPAEPPAPAAPAGPAGPAGTAGAAGDGVGAAIGRIWADVLAVPSVAAGDNFLDLGGNSITAVQAATRIEQQLALRVEPADVLLAGSLAELAEQVAAAGAAGAAVR